MWVRSRLTRPFSLRLYACLTMVKGDRLVWRSHSSFRVKVHRATATQEGDNRYAMGCLLKNTSLSSRTLLSYGWLEDAQKLPRVKILSYAEVWQQGFVNQESLWLWILWGSSRA